MDMKYLNKILWWIPIRDCRNFIRDYFHKINRIEEKIDSLTYMNANVTSFRSEFRQDLEAYIYLKRLNKKPMDCFYVDIGAYDGINISNSYVFEELGWDGICVEANPRIFDKLKQNRKSNLYNVAIADKTSSVDFIDVENVILLSGISDSMDKKRFDMIEKYNGKINRIKIQSMSFDDLMKNHKRTHIDFLSLDVEGAELTILKSIDFSKYTFSLMTIENNEPDNVLVDFMNEKGYKEYKNVGNDIMFIQK